MFLLVSYKPYHHKVNHMIGFAQQDISFVFSLSRLSLFRQQFLFELL